MKGVNECDMKKRLNICLPKELYERMVDKVKNSDIKNITELIKFSCDKFMKQDINKDSVIECEELPKILDILNVLYDVKRFKNPDVKLELQYLYNNIKGILENSIESKDYQINRLDISMKELIVLELSCRELDILIKNNIIKESVYYAN